MLFIVQRLVLYFLLGFRELMQYFCPNVIIGNIAKVGGQHYFFLVQTIIIIIIIINLFIEGSLISAKALFCLRALFGATRIHSCTRMASLIRTRLSDLCTRREVGTFGEETFGYNCTPG